jgi:hypothetical protein
MTNLLVKAASQKKAISELAESVETSHSFGLQKMKADGNSSNIKKIDNIESLFSKVLTKISNCYAF